jgi:glycerol-3-phosphate dehydrogenase
MAQPFGTARSRDQIFDALEQSSGSPTGELDVLVIGGGVTGAGIALDAATRGLTTGIVEAQDWSSGTSSRSSKLVHGGLRYLQMLDFNLVHEALTERDLLLKELAPHLVRPVAFLYPLTEHWERPYVGAGIALYDTLATLAPGRRALPWHRHLSRDTLLKRFPDLAPTTAVGAIQYWDATVDDARLVLSLVRTAISFGAIAASRAQVVALTRSDGGVVNGAEIEDLESGRRITVRARAVINATGVWTEKTQDLAGNEGGLHVLASKGIHIVVPRSRIRGEVGLILQTEKSVLFVIPWSRYWIIGTTDTPYTQDLTDPVASSADIDYVLDHANAVLATPLTRDDVIGTFAGLRPLLQPGTKAGTTSAKVSREHTVASPAPGLSVIAGGKLTTYRVMAKDAVDHALGRRADLLPSITQTIPLIGAVGLQAVARRSHIWAKRFGWTAAMVDHLLHRYGSEVTDLAALCEADPELARPLEHAPAYLRAEIHFAVTREDVLHLDDLLMRRTRLVYEVPDSGLAALDEIAAITAPLLRWTAKKTAAEKAAYRSVIASYVSAAATSDDTSAQAARAGATAVVASSLG